MGERRDLPRLSIKKESKMWMSQTQSFVHCVIEDIHLKGMCVSFNKQVLRPWLGNVSFAIGDNFDLIRVETQVPWTKEDQGRYIYGLSFSKIDDQDKDKIYDYISTNCYDQFKDNWWDGIGKVDEVK